MASQRVNLKKNLLSGVMAVMENCMDKNGWAARIPTRFSWVQGHNSLI